MTINRPSRFARLAGAASDRLTRPRPTSPMRASASKPSAPSKVGERVYRSPGSGSDTYHFPPGTKFYGDPGSGSGKVKVPKPNRPAGSGSAAPATDRPRS